MLGGRVSARCSRWRAACVLRPQRQSRPGRGPQRLASAVVPAARLRCGARSCGHGVQFTSFAALTAFRARRVRSRGARGARAGRKPCAPRRLTCALQASPRPALHQQWWRAPSGTPRVAVGAAGGTRQGFGLRRSAFCADCAAMLRPERPRGNSLRSLCSLSLKHSPGNQMSRRAARAPPGSSASRRLRLTLDGYRPPRQPPPVACHSGHATRAGGKSAGGRPAARM